MHSGIHILTIPFPAGGHMLPHMDLIHQLLLRGLTVTIVVTPKNLHHLNPLLSLHSPNNVQALILPFPSHSSIPTGVEYLQEISSVHYFIAAFSKLREPLLEWFQTHHSPPVAIISDMFFSPWVNSLASYLNIKNLSFSVINANSLFPWMLEDLKLDSDTSSPRFHIGTVQSWGLILNTFYELDGDQMDMIKEKFMNHGHLWAIGPLLPIKTTNNASRGGPSSIPQDQIMAWLDSCHDKSVVYVGFGTTITLKKLHMESIASALEESGVRFIWAVKKPVLNDDDQDLVPPGFERRLAGRGLVIKGWTPQLAILEHRAVGSYLNHCGWNSVLEGLLGDVLLLAWPMQADHFENANLLVDKFRVAVRVWEGLDTAPDASTLARILSDSVNTDRPERVPAMKLKNTAMAATLKDGSSDKALDGLIKALCSFKTATMEEQIVL